MKLLSLFLMFVSSWAFGDCFKGLVKTGSYATPKQILYSAQNMPNPALQLPKDKSAVEILKFVEGKPPPKLSIEYEGQPVASTVDYNPATKKFSFTTKDFEKVSNTVDELNHRGWKLTVKATETEFFHADGTLSKELTGSVETGQKIKVKYSKASNAKISETGWLYKDREGKWVIDSVEDPTKTGTRYTRYKVGASPDPLASLSREFTIPLN